MGVLQTWYLAYWWVSNCFFHELSYDKGFDPPFLSLFSMSFVLPSIICLVSWIPRIPVLCTPACHTIAYQIQTAAHVIACCTDHRTTSAMISSAIICSATLISTTVWMEAKRYQPPEHNMQCEKLDFDPLHQISWLSWIYHSKGIWEMVSQSL